MKVQYAFLTEKVIRDEDSKKFSFIDIFDRFATLTPKSFYAVARITDAPKGDAVLVVKIANEKNPEKIASSIEIPGTVTVGEIDVVALFAPFVFPEPGRYRLILELGGNEVTEGVSLAFDVTSNSTLNNGTVI